MYSGHYPRIFVAPKNAQNAETKHQSGAGPILLLALSAPMTSAYTSLGFLQELNPQAQLRKALVYHSATSAVPRQRAAAGRREEENDQQCTRCKTPGEVEHKSAQQLAVREVLGVVECESAQQAAAREIPGVVERKSAQQAAAREVPL